MEKKKTVAPLYSGDLAKPIVGRPVPLLNADEWIKEEAKRITEERWSKLEPLCRVHGVEVGNWFGLAMRLAETHVPGFRVIEKAGRKVEWSIVDKASYKISIDELVERDSIPILEAIRKLQRAGEWSQRTKGSSVEALAKHYYKADHRMVNVLHDARAWEQHLRDLDSTSDPEAPDSAS